MKNYHKKDSIYIKISSRCHSIVHPSSSTSSYTFHQKKPQCFPQPNVFFLSIVNDMIPLFIRKKLFLVLAAVVANLTVPICRLFFTLLDYIFIYIREKFDLRRARHLHGPALFHRFLSNNHYCRQYFGRRLSLSVLRWSKYT